MLIAIFGLRQYAKLGLTFLLLFSVACSDPFAVKPNRGVGFVKYIEKIFSLCLKTCGESQKASLILY